MLDSWILFDIFFRNGDDIIYNNYLKLNTEMINNMNSIDNDDFYNKYFENK